jgi:AbrB family looped-hinge helix DNA binding protein
VKISKTNFTHRVVIPAKIMKELKLKKGDDMKIYTKDRKIIIERKEIEDGNI